MERVNILGLEDSRTDRELVERALENARFGHSIEWVQSRKEYEEVVRRAGFQLIIADFTMPGYSGDVALAFAREHVPEVPFIFVSGTLEVEHAVEMLKQGATDYVVKEQLHRLPAALERALREAEERAARNEAEEQLRASREQFASAFEHAAIGMAVFDLDFRWQAVNPALCRMLGYTREELLQKSFPEITHPEDLDENVRLLRELLAGQRDHFQMEKRYLQSSGSIVWGILNVSLVKDRAGKPLRLISQVQDITHRKQAELRLREIEERYRAVFDRSLDAVYLSDFRGRFLDANPAALKLLGYEAEEVRSLSFADVLHDPADLARAHESIQALLRSGVKESTSEYRLKRKDGQCVWVEILASVVNKNGQPYAVQGLARDITDRRAAEEALRASEERYRSIIENEPECVKITAPDTTILEMNPAGLQMLGARSPDDVLGKRVTSFVEPEDLNAYLEMHRRVCAGERSELRFRIGGAKGASRWMEAHSVPLRDAEGKITRLLSVARDVTSALQAEADRRQLMRRLEEQANLLDHARDAIIVADLSRRIAYWNRGAETIFGWTSAEALGRDLGELVARDKTAFDRAFVAARESGQWSGELEKTRKDGRKITVDGRWVRLAHPGGQPKSVLCISTDITDKKKLEAQFLRTQRMESIGTLAGGIAHDLNNVLAPIMIAIDVLQTECSSADAVEMLKTLQSSAERGAALVKQILSFARGVEGSRVALDPTHILRELQRTLQTSFPKNIQVRLETPARGCTVLGDATQLHQVFLNLCVNARDAMPSGGVLQIATAERTLDEVYSGMTPAAKPGPYLVISFEDTGVGIPREIIDKIFDPFFTTKEVGQGTGLGLATSLAIVKSHGGFIDLATEVGKGTTFSVFLPVHSGSGPPEAADAVGGMPRGRNELILVADDDPNVRSIVQKTLQHFGYRVLLAQNGAEAVSLFVANQAEVAAVITDMTMPIMDGPALIAALRAISPTAEIIAFGGNVAGASVEKALAAGVREFIPKPHTGEKLLLALDKALRERRGETR